VKTVQSVLMCSHSSDVHLCDSASGLSLVSLLDSWDYNADIVVICLLHIESHLS